MELWIGAAGSGKSSAVLAGIQPDLRAGRSRVAVLTPTAGMADLLRTRLARGGAAVRPGCITALTDFIQPLAHDIAGISAPAFHLLVERVVQQLAPASFAAVREHAGFRRALVGALQEMFAAEATARRLERLVDTGVLTGPIVTDFVAVFAGVEAELLHRGQGLRSHRLERAAQVIRERGLHQKSERIYFDGFTALTALELDVIDALISRGISVTVTLPDTPLAAETRAALQQKGFTERHFTRCRQPTRTVLAPAPTLAQETVEVSRRILQAHTEHGRPWRDMLVLVRQPGIYGPVLRNAFARFGIPGAFHFGGTLHEHPMIRYVGRLIEALLHNWDHEYLLRAWEMGVSGYGGTLQGDALLNQLRAGLPNRGAPPPDLHGLSALSEWVTVMLLPNEWAHRLRELTGRLFPAPTMLPSNAEEARQYRERETVRRQCEEALTNLGQLLAPEPLPLLPFWRAAQMVMETTALASPGAPADAVPVMTVSEGREREAALVFVVGLLEGQFPAEPQQEPILSDALRAALRPHHLRLPTLADQQEQERWLLEVALSRATDELVLTHPQYKPSGEPLLPSFALAEIAVVREEARPIRPAPQWPRATLRRPGIYDEELRELLRERHGELFPTSIESFLQCRFQFFARHTLGLGGPPSAPGDRLNMLVQGTLVHRVIAMWHRRPDIDLPAYFEQEFQTLCEREKVPPGYTTESIRLRLWRDILRFTSTVTLPPDSQTLIEHGFSLTFGDVTIRGRMDRCDVAPDGSAVIYDYKYSGRSGIDRRMNEEAQARFVQGGLYLMAAQAQQWQPAGFHYHGLRGPQPPRGWDTPEDVAKLIDDARTATLTVIDEIRAGRIDVLPTDREGCAFCDFLDACRVRSAERTRQAGGDG